MENRVLKKLQNTELEILKAIDKVCKKKDLHYFISYGTLLGSVRHKGFIPWDDDIDIAMPREDFDKFIEIANKELESKYRLDYFNTNKKYYLPFAKVYNTNTTFIESTTTKYDGEKGIFVDIFPYDDVKYPYHTKKYIRKEKILNILHAILLSKSLKTPSSGKIKFLSKLISNRFAGKLINLLAKGPKNSDYYTCYSISGLSKCYIFQKDDIFPLKKIEFEKETFFCPGNYKKILSTCFGDDYMKLPKKEDRVTHNPVLIRFEDGEEFNLQDKKD